MKTMLLLCGVVISGSCFAQVGSPVAPGDDMNADRLPGRQAAAATGPSLFYLGHLYHNCSIQTASADGATVVFSTDSGLLSTQWKNVPAIGQKTFLSDYNAAVAGSAQQKQEAENQSSQSSGSDVAIQFQEDTKKQHDADLDNDVLWITKASVLSKTDDGMLIQLGDMIFFVSDDPDAGSLADDDAVPPFKASLGGLYQYQTAGNASKTVHALKYLTAISSDQAHALTAYYVRMNKGQDGSAQQSP